MPVNQYLPFAVGVSPDVLTPAAYSALPARSSGFATGVALATQLNTVWRQAGTMSHALGQVISDNLNEDVLDNGNMAALINQVKRLLEQTAVLRIPIGKIDFFPYDALPAGYVFAAGQAISRTTYAALFAKIGTTYGVGNGTTTFNVPDYRGRALFGKDNMGGAAANRITTAGSGIAGSTTGATGGSEFAQTHTHSASDLGHGHVLDNPAHTHGAWDGGHAHGIHDPGHAHSGITDAQGAHAHELNTNGLGISGATFIVNANEGGLHGGSGKISSSTTGAGNHAHNVTVWGATTGISTHTGWASVTVNAAATAVTANTGHANISVTASLSGTSQNMPPAAIVAVAIFTGVF